MSAITLPTRTTQSGLLRPISPLRDLPAVTELLELCFHNRLEHQPQRSPVGGGIPWAPRLAATATMPRNGFVWEQDGRIVGNVSLIPFHYRKRCIYLIANVATHPEYRRRGIGRALTERAMQYARQRKADQLWLQVRDDNPMAIRLYADLGFVERDRRTFWASSPDLIPAAVPGDYIIVRRPAHAWQDQQAWLRRLYPDDQAWYRHFEWDLFSPALHYWLYRFIMDIPVRHWAVESGGHLQAIVSWISWRGDSDTLWLALPPQTDEQALAFLLCRLQQETFYRRTLNVDLPLGQAEEALRAAGFQPQRILLWMSAPGATK